MLVILRQNESSTAKSRQPGSQTAKREQLRESGRGNQSVIMDSESQRCPLKLSPDLFGLTRCSLLLDGRAGIRYSPTGIISATVEIGKSLRRRCQAPVSNGFDTFDTSARNSNERSPLIPQASNHFDRILKRCQCQRLKQDLQQKTASLTSPNILQVRQAWLTPHISKAVNDSGEMFGIPFHCTVPFWAN
ncbi:hypothetical protein CEXT_541331 [Caerostris extrusa]|uniref:Uncharacterized protein n=1 Tax=Caerostris extrusa TaxID=172846 RepID=A0AAV4XET4_CAEEX|nr:hypothetical protein CEXT_541331 [Caerostris extrusa]